MATQYYDYGFAELRLGFEETEARFLLIISFRSSLNCSRISCSMKVFPTIGGIQTSWMVSV